MKLKIRYDEAYQVLDLDEQAIEQLWVSLDLDGGEALSQEEREKRIQEAFDAKYNRPEYNSWRKLNRHRGEPKAKPGKDETEEDIDTSEPLMSEVADDRIFRQDELSREEREQYEAICEWVRSVLAVVGGIHRGTYGRRTDEGLRGFHRRRPHHGHALAAPRRKKVERKL